MGDSEETLQTRPPMNTIYAIRSTAVSLELVRSFLNNDNGAMDGQAAGGRIDTSSEDISPVLLVFYQSRQCCKYMGMD